MNIREVNQNASILEVVGAYIEVRGSTLKSAKALCPFHADSHPSLGFYKRNGEERYKCFSCGAGGNAVDFVMNYERKLGNEMSVQKAAARVAEICGLEYSYSGPEPVRDRNFENARRLTSYFTHTKQGMVYVQNLADMLDIPANDAVKLDALEVLQSYNAGIVPDSSLKLSSEAETALKKFKLSPGSIAIPDGNKFADSFIAGMVSSKAPMLLCDSFEDVLRVDVCGYSGRFSGGTGKVSPMYARNLDDYALKRLSDISKAAGETVMIACHNASEGLQRAKILKKHGFNPLILPGCPDRHMKDFSSYLNAYMRPYEFCLMYGNPKEAIEFADSPLEKADCRRKAEEIEK